MTIGETDVPTALVSGIAGRGSKPRRNERWKEVASFVDEGDDKIIIRKRGNRLAVTRETTDSEMMSSCAAKIIGQRIRDRRRAIGMTALEVAQKSGLGGPSASLTTKKHYMISLENAARGHGPRLGTLYTIAAALGCEVHSLIPSIDEVVSLSLGKVER